MRYSLASAPAAVERVLPVEPGSEGVGQVEVTKLQVRAGGLELGLAAGPQAGIGRGQPQLGLLVLEDMAAARPESRGGERREAGGRAEVERRRGALRSEVGVPHHLGQGHGHLEAAALEAEHAEGLQAYVGQVDARVAAREVVDERRGVRRRWVERARLLLLLPGRVVEVARHAEDEAIAAEREVWHDAEQAPPIVRQVAETFGRPLVASQGVDLEGLILDRTRAGRYLRGRGGGRRDDEQRCHEQARQSSLHSLGDSSPDRRLWARIAR